MPPQFNLKFIGINETLKKSAHDLFLILELSCIQMTKTKR